MDIFYGNLFHNYSCGSFHELNMSSVLKLGVIRLNYKRWGSNWGGSNTGSGELISLAMSRVAHLQPMRGLPSQKQSAAEKIDFSIWAIFDSFWNRKLKLTNLSPVVTKEQIKYATSLSLLEVRGLRQGNEIEFKMQFCSPLHCKSVSV